MVTAAQYRLICEVPDHAVAACVFDASPGKKPCKDGLSVDVEKSQAGTFARIALAGREQGSLKLDWWRNTLWYKETHETYSCKNSEVNPDDEKLIAEMPNTHPRSWRLIKDHLDERFDEYNTFRDQTADYLKRGLSDDEMWPSLLTEICFDESNNWESIPQLDVPENLPTDDLWSTPTELRECAYGHYKTDPVSQEWTWDVKQDQGCFWNTLVNFIPKTPYVPPQDGVVDILDLGCGMASGAVPLVDYFRKQGSLNLPPLGPLNQKVRYVGVDPSQEEIESAQKINPQSENFSFVADYSEDFFQKNPQKQFDVILFRHPGPIKDDWTGDASHTWSQAFQDAFQHLSQNGIMIITTYYTYEYLFVQHIFENEPGAFIYLTGQNPSSFKKDGLERDKYLMVVGKQVPWDSVLDN